MGRRDGRVVEWDLERNEAVTEWRALAVRSLRYTPDGGKVALARSRIVEVRDATNGAVLTKSTFPGFAHEVDWHPEGRVLAVACEDGAVYLVDAADGAARVLGRHKAQTVGVQFTPDGEFLVSAGWDRELNVWNFRTERREAMLPLRVSNMQFDRSGRRLSVHDTKGLAVALEFNPGAECRPFRAELTGVPRLARFSPDQRWLTVMTTDSVTVWDLKQPGPPARAMDQGANPLGFSPDSSQFVAWRPEQTFHWRLAPGTNGGAPQLARLPVLKLGEPLSLRLLTEPVAMSLPGRSGMRTVLVTNATAGSGFTLRGPEWQGAISPDGRWLAQRTGSERLHLTSLLESGPTVYLTNSSRVRFQAFSPDGASLAVLTEKDLSLFDTKTWAVRASRPTDTGGLYHLTYSPDGRLLLCAENTRTAYVLDARTLETLLPLPEWTHALAFSPDGRWLVTTVESRRVQLWDWVAVRKKFWELGIDWRD